MVDPKRSFRSFKAWRSDLNPFWQAPIWAPLLIFDWLCEGINGLIQRWDFIKLLETAGKFTILIAIIVYFSESDERKKEAENQRKQKIYQAWQVINTAKSGSSGIEYALSELLEEGQPLVGIDLSNAYLPKSILNDLDLSVANFQNAVLAGSNLAGARLWKAKLGGADLTLADLTEAKLWGADLTGADLGSTNLEGAKLGGADLTGADLNGADLTGAYLEEANLAGANLIGAKLRGTNLYKANLTETILWGADLMEANLGNIQHWRDIKSIKLANIYGIKKDNSMEGFIKWAKEKGAEEIESALVWFLFKGEAPEAMKGWDELVNLEKWWYNNREEIIKKHKSESEEENK